MSTRAWRIREIIGHLDALVDDLDLGETPIPLESFAKSVLREQRAMFVRMLAQEWAVEVSDEPVWDCSGVAQNTAAMVRAERAEAMRRKS